MTAPENLPRVQEWMQAYPREAWAYEELPQGDSLRERVLTAILQHRSQDDAAIDDLVRFADALEAREKAADAGKVTTAPPLNRCRQYKIQIVRMKHVSQGISTFFRVDFTTDQGWSGFFDTSNPMIIERINKNPGSRPIIVVGAVTQRPYDFMVKLGGPVRIV